jgi:hypothetical protein
MAVSLCSLLRTSAGKRESTGLLASGNDKRNRLKLFRGHGLWRFRDQVAQCPSEGFIQVRRRRAVLAVFAEKTPGKGDGEIRPVLFDILVGPGAGDVVGDELAVVACVTD